MSKWVQLNQDANFPFTIENSEIISGTILRNTDSENNFMQRYNPYKIKTDSGDLVDVYSGNSPLKAFVNQHVELQGRFMEFELEGKNVREFWPLRIRLV